MKFTVPKACDGTDWVLAKKVSQSEDGSYTYVSGYAYTKKNQTKTTVIFKNVKPGVYYLTGRAYVKGYAKNYTKWSVWLLFTHLTWPEGWIPSRWSDFGFWKEKVDQAVAEFKLYLMLPKTVSQTEGMILGGKTVCAGGGSFSVGYYSMYNHLE